MKELLNGCICCNLVGQLGDALETLRRDVAPDRILIETSGSAFPATLAMEVNRLERETGDFVLDGVVVVIDVENWKGYEDTSYTAKMQARYTDLMVLNKWELVGERRYEDCLDRIGDLDLQIASVKSDRGRVDQSVLLGLDSTLAKEDGIANGQAHGQGENHHHAEDHQSEVEVLSVTLSSQNPSHGVDLEALDKLLTSAPKDEVYRIKGIIMASRPPASSDSPARQSITLSEHRLAKYILNWSFGRWIFTPVASPKSTGSEPDGTAMYFMLRMTMVLARCEAEKWKKRIETDKYFVPEATHEKSALLVERLM